MNKRNKIILIAVLCLIALLLVLSGVMLYFALSDKDSKDSTPSRNTTQVADKIDPVYIEKCEKLLKNERKKIVDKYGLSPKKIRTIDSVDDNDVSWADSDGVVSSLLFDLDDDGVNELIVVRILEGVTDPEAESLELAVYSSDSKAVKLVGKINLPYGNDLTEKHIDMFVCELKGKKAIFFEGDFSVSFSDVLVPKYYVIRYNSEQLYKEIYLDFSQMLGQFSKWTETIFVGDKKGTRDIYKSEIGPDYEYTTSGEYKDSEKPAYDYFESLGMPKTQEYFCVEGFPRYMNVAAIERLCEMKLKRIDDLYSFSSSIIDYTKLDEVFADAVDEKTEKAESEKDKAGSDTNKTQTKKEENKDKSEVSDTSQVKEYTAEQLSKKSVKEIVEIMGGDFKHDHAKGVIYYTSGGDYIYNDEKLPGFVIYLKSDSDLGEFSNKSTKTLKEEINKGLYQIDFIAMYDNAKLNNEISADMNYKEFISTFGDVTTSVLPGAGYLGHYITYNVADISDVVVFYSSKGVDVSYDDIDSSMKSENPDIHAIVAIENTSY